MMWRRQFITLGAGLIALTAVPAVGQEGAVSADRIRSVYSNDELFERMVLSLYALRATLYLANPETDANALSAFNSSNTMFAASMAEADKERSTVLAAINQDPEPVGISDRIRSAIQRIGQELNSIGLSRESVIHTIMISNLEVYLAAQVKIGRNIEDWFCNIFPFSDFC